MSSLSGLPLPFSPLAFIILFKIFFILTDTQLMGRLGIKGLTILKYKWNGCIWITRGLYGAFNWAQLLDSCCFTEIIHNKKFRIFLQEQVIHMHVKRLGNSSKACKSAQSWMTLTTSRVIEKAKSLRTTDQRWLCGGGWAEAGGVEFC